MTKGGARPGAGRKRGGKNPSTLEKEATLAVLRQRILQNAQSLFNAAKSAAIGNQYLYKIETTIDPKTKKRTRSRPVIVESQIEIEDYIDRLDRENRGETVDDEDDTVYYFISTKEPNVNAIKDLFDRAFGKPKEELEISGSMSISDVLNGLEQRKSKKNG